ncbi:hypothetical protein ACFFIF_01905 [Vagococcus entomophilus]|uniref:Uncharacterized protein n=1 Tax=Vagococcus entomophilus TaxID=1160095 RepID=A0A430AKD7_9ENTE|nr:hypothetical protein [Vagococcus entomophilus]RSU08444.1 hypothetical protein CBF30_04175 [Vagococcus entomophilus]
MNYFYISLSKDVVTQHEAIKQSTLYKDYSILEFTREANEHECDVMDLVYCGHGNRDSEHVLLAIKRYTDRYK